MAGKTISGGAWIEFAPDGKHFHVIKKGMLSKLWDYFTYSPDIRQQIHINPNAKFRLVNNTGLCCELPRPVKE